MIPTSGVSDGVRLGEHPNARETSFDEVLAWFKNQGKAILTFVGYSASGYEDHSGMMKIAAKILADHDFSKTIVNIGGTPTGIGAVYRLAKEIGFDTSGIISVRAKSDNVALSRWADVVFLVPDETWGGFMKGTGKLSPTSQLIVETADQIVGIGGGDICRDELIAGLKAGKSVIFHQSEMNHRMAIDTARKKKFPIPTDFRGPAGVYFALRKAQLSPKK